MKEFLCKPCGKYRDMKLAVKRDNQKLICNICVTKIQLAVEAEKQEVKTPRLKKSSGIGKDEVSTECRTEIAREFKEKKRSIRAITKKEAEAIEGKRRKDRILFERELKGINGDSFLD